MIGGSPIIERDDNDILDTQSPNTVFENPSKSIKLESNIYSNPVKVFSKNEGKISR